MDTRNRLLAQEKAEIIKSLPVRSDIFLPTSKVPLAHQVEGLKHVKRLYQNDLSNIYKPRLEALKKGLQGRKRCFLIGNGPSLNDTDLSLLKDEITFAVNGFFLKAKDLAWKPTFYIVEDHLVAEDRAKDLQAFKGPIKFYPAYLGYCMPSADDTIFYNHRPRVSYPDGFDFSLNADKITYTGCTVMFSAMQLAAYMGFEDIYLIGVDASYEVPEDTQVSEDYGTSVLDMDTDDPNHFHPDYFGKGFRWHDPQVDKMLEAYTEAKKVCESVHINIVNATVGGELEVFERADYSSLFKVTGQDLAGEAAGKLPRILVVDFTRFGHGTATGEVKAKFFSTWNSSDIFHIYGEAGSDFGINNGGVDTGRRYSYEAVLEQVKSFKADVILYRPVADHAHLHDLAMKIIADIKLPYAIWLMDDWPARQLEENPALGVRMRADLLQLCQSSNACLAISDAMAGAFGARYGAKFDVFHNGVIKSKWKMKKNKVKSGSPITIRYSGGLASDMTLQALQDIAQAVTGVSADIPIKFEIRCQKHWLPTALLAFQNNSVVNVAVADQTLEEYRQWLVDADILVICNNFDLESQRYIQHSFANKIPEYLASGQPVLAYGPAGLASMDYLDRVDGVTRVSEVNIETLKGVISRLAKSARLRSSLGQKSQTHAFKYLDFKSTQSDFESLFSKVAREPFKGFCYRPYAPKIKRKIPSHMLKSLKKYLLSWKGMIGFVGAICMILGVYLMVASPSSLIRTFAIILIMTGHLVPFLLLAHLSAIVESKFDGRSN